MKAKPVILGAAVVVAATLLSACDTSPAAATVNGQSVSTSQLLDELQQWASSKQYVLEFDSSASQQNYNPLHGAGSATYGTDWVALRLQYMIESLAISRYTSAHGLSPSTAQEQAAWSSEYAYFGPAWDQFPSSLRATIVQRAADHALIEPVRDLKDDTTFYNQHKSAYWSQVCVREVDFFANAGSNAAEKAADAATRIDEGFGAQISGGSRRCLTPEQLDGTAGWYHDAALATAAGKASKPISQPWGDAVLQVVSRDRIPLDKAVEVSIEVAQEDAQAIADPAAYKILDSANVKVNPAYGTWLIQGGYPFVLPPDKQAPKGATS